MSDVSFKEVAQACEDLRSEDLDKFHAAIILLTEIYKVLGDENKIVHDLHFYTDIAKFERLDCLLLLLVPYIWKENNNDQLKFEHLNSTILTAVTEAEAENAPVSICVDGSYNVNNIYKVLLYWLSKFKQSTRPILYSKEPVKQVFAHLCTQAADAT